MYDIKTQHMKFVMDLLKCNPLGERARELRAMVLRLERIRPELEQQRVEEMGKLVSRSEESTRSAVA